MLRFIVYFENDKRKVTTSFRTLYVEVYQHIFDYEIYRFPSFRTLYVEVYLEEAVIADTERRMFPYIIC